MKKDSKMIGLIKSRNCGIVCLFFLSLAVSLFISACDSNYSTEEQSPEVDPFVYAGGVLEKGETVAEALRKKGLGGTAVYQLTHQLNEIYNLRRALPADSFLIVMDTLSIVQRLNYYPAREKIRTYAVIRDTTGLYYCSIDTLQVEKVYRKVEQTISSSLYASMRELGEGPYLIGKLTEIFQWDIDFLIDPRIGDRFSLVFEQYMTDGQFVKYGEILVAEYQGANYHKRAYRFDTGENSKYFNKEGISFQKAFLKSPLNYTRISSYFSKGRYHPVLKIVRPHNGVDYAAPNGTPVVAASDGVVSHADWKGGHPTVRGMSGGYGKTVMIRHSNGYETLYGHLSNYAKGIRKGVRVSQNQVIGYVGSTGLSTGAHLHYTVYQNGVAIDPLKMNNVAGPPVPKAKMEEFNNRVTEMDTLIDKPVGYFLELVVQQ